MMGLLIVVHSVGMVMKYRFLNSDGLALLSSRIDDAMTAFCFTRRGWPLYGSDNSSRCSTVNRSDLTCCTPRGVSFLQLEALLNTVCAVRKASVKWNLQYHPERPTVAPGNTSLTKDVASMIVSGPQTENWLVKLI